MLQVVVYIDIFTTYVLLDWLLNSAAQHGLPAGGEAGALRWAGVGRKSAGSVDTGGQELRRAGSARWNQLHASLAVLSQTQGLADFFQN